MSMVRSVNTKPEMPIRSFRHRYGFCFRLHMKHLPRPQNIVLSKYMTIIDARGNTMKCAKKSYNTSV